MSDFNIDFPIPSELLGQLSKLSSQQQAFLAGYLWAGSQNGSPLQQATTSLTASASRKITVISISQTGNAAGVAKKLTDRLKAESLDANLINAGSYKARQLTKEDIVVIATSTQGDGEPPEEGVPLHSYLFGKKAPKLEGLSFAVIGLGDSSYPHFCQAGVDFDAKLAELGAERLLDRVDADVDFAAIADSWIDKAVEKLKAIAGKGLGQTVLIPSSEENVHGNSIYNKDNPYTATLLTSHPLVTDDAGRMIMHIEVDLDESGLQYQVGDALGVVTHNALGTVDEVLNLNDLSGEEKIESRRGTTSIREALIAQCDLNQLTPKFLADYADTLKNDALQVKPSTTSGL